MPQNPGIRGAEENRHVETVLRRVPDHGHSGNQVAATSGPSECYLVEGNCHDQAQSI